MATIEPEGEARTVPLIWIDKDAHPGPVRQSTPGPAPEFGMTAQRMREFILVMQESIEQY